jgi:hypothetical protein
MQASLDGPIDVAHATQRPPNVAARRLTLIAAALLLAGVPVQAFLAGGLLAGRSAIGELHQPVGHFLVLLGFVPLVAGLIGRRWVKEPIRVLLVRFAVAAVHAATVRRRARSLSIA